MIVYISIGNSDDKLSQRQWAEFYSNVAMRLHFPWTDTLDQNPVKEVHGQWASEPASQWQNACWCVDLAENDPEPLKKMLRFLAAQFGQDSIAWAEAPNTEFLGAN